MKLVNIRASLRHWLSDPMHRRLLCLSTVLALFLTVMSMPIEFLLFFGDFQLGEKAPGNLIAPRDYFIVETAGIEKRKNKVRQTAPAVYDLDTEVLEKAESSLDEAFVHMRAWNEARKAERMADPEVFSEHAYREFLRQFTALDVPKDVFAVLQSLGFSKELHAAVVDSVRSALVRGFVESSDRVDRRRKTVKRLLPDYEESLTNEPEFIFGRVELAEHAELRLRRSAPWLKGGMPAVARFVAVFCQPNTIMNVDETGRREHDALRKVQATHVTVRRGELVVARGETILPTVYEKIRAIRAEELRRLGVTSLLINFFFYFFVNTVFFIVARASVKKFLSDAKSILFVVVVISLTVLFAVLFYLTGVFLSLVYPIYPFTIVLFVPFALGGMLLRLFLNSETALVGIFYLTVTFANMYKDNFYIALFVTFSALVGAHLIGHFYTRAQILRSSMKVGLINMLLALFVLSSFGDIAGGIAGGRLMVISGVFLSGISAAVLLISVTPVLEYLFRYTTNIKLLELSSLDHPLMRELMVKAPGTYNHSITIGTLVEAAAQSIGVNPLLAKVGAYYHDIGKIRMPEFFVENQMGGINKHDELSPYMSALIIASHTKEGCEIARQYGLGAPITDAIMQHHGTRLISYFYAKALKQDPAVQEENFRYSGTKPVRREIALIMMADAVEAACRVLDDPSPARIRAVVKKNIYDILMDGQLDECGLTLRDISTVIESFTRTLMGVHHQRIDYPHLRQAKGNGKAH